MTSLLNAFRSAIAYSRAGTLMSQGEYVAAIPKIEEAKTFAGSSLKKPGLFNYYIRAAYLYFRVEDKEKSILNVANARDSINRYRSISEIDRSYLLDFCDLFVAIIEEHGEDPVLRLYCDQHHRVSKRFKKDYPLRFL